MAEQSKTIIVTERDLQDTTLVCIDLDRNIWIKEGFPKKLDTGIVDRETLKNMSGPPYVFTANELTLFDRSHPSGAKVKDVTVIFMHGGRQGNGTWVFSSYTDGYPVIETVDRANEYLKEKGRKQIQVIMACNESPSPEGVKIGELPPKKVVYAVGEKVGLKYAAMDESGKITAAIKADDFWGLDDLLTEQQITIF